MLWNHCRWIELEQHIRYSISWHALTSPCLSSLPLYVPKSLVFAFGAVNGTAPTYIIAPRHPCSILPSTVSQPSLPVIPHDDISHSRHFSCVVTQLYPVSGWSLKETLNGTLRNVSRPFFFRISSANSLYPWPFPDFSLDYSIVMVLLDSTGGPFYYALVL